MNGLIVFIGESFRLGCQWTTNRGSPESYIGQIHACNSHIKFIETIVNKYKLNSMSVFMSTYSTPYSNDLLTIYNKYLIGYHIYDNLIGINNLFHKSINEVKDLDNYDFILYIRIDIYLKQHFIDVFNPTINMILFPTIVWSSHCVWKKHPRVNDMLLFIPKKYYNYIQKIIICHEAWCNLINDSDLTYDDIDVIINTFHDSDSAKDYNPLYYIVNRPICNDNHSAGYAFNKYRFRQKMHGNIRKIKKYNNVNAF
jgi:hypothetical protein